MSQKRAVYDIAEFKASTDTPGEFKAVVSVFNNVDLQGDRVMPGAFKNSLAQWKASGDPIPVIWSHDWADPFAHIGVVTSAQETAQGLQITGKNDLEKPFAKQVHDLLVSRRVTGMSFAYDVNAERPAKDGANELTDLGLIEVGPTLKGANPDAQLVQAKSLLEAAASKQAGEKIVLDDTDGMKAGARLSQATQQEMQAIHDGMIALAGRMASMMGNASEAAPKSVGPDDDEPDPEDEGAPAAATTSDKIEDQPEVEQDREPSTAKSRDTDTLRLLTSVAEALASNGSTT